MNKTYIPRVWQAKSFSIIDKAFISTNNEIIPVNACVGSGKTDLACYSFGKFIVDNHDHKTISVFVSPRIKLCSQQEDSIASFIDSNFDLKNKKDYVINSINCTDGSFNRKSGELVSDHVVFVFCAASLWDIDSSASDPEYRWHRWFHNFKKWSEENGYKLGSIFYDESHNYENNVDKITKLSELFKLTILASGTPAYYQKELSKKYKKNVCSCAPYEAMDKKMICKPSLNMIRGNADIDFPRAIQAVLKRESDICRNEMFDSRILVNCSSIDQINSILSHSWFDGKIGNDFHVITIHSPKEYVIDNEKKILDSRIDNNLEKSSQDAYDAIEKLDESYFNDDLPVLVFQVGMIGEGINVKCFNSVIITTHTEKTAMQQIGRAVRNCFMQGKNKIDDGHANVYAFMENLTELQQLIVNLQEYELTSDCFTWGKLLDISTGSGTTYNAEYAETNDLNSFDWNEMSQIDILTIMNAADIKCGKKYRAAFIEELFDENPGLVEEFMTALSKTDYAKEFGYTGVNMSKFSIDEFKEKTKPDKDSVSHEDADAVIDHDNKKNTSVEISKDLIIDHLIILNTYIESHREVFSRLFFTDKKSVFLSKIFGNNVIAEFFAKTLNEDFMKKMLKIS